jgi:hypothetical protein
VRRNECAREADVLEALQTSAWPECCGGELRTHVQACSSCTDLVDVVQPLLQEHRAAMLEARVPSSGIVWWRAQMRARREAARTATRPINVLEGVAGACALGLLAGLIGFVSPAAQDAWTVVNSGITPSVPWSELLYTPVGVTAMAGMAIAAIVAPLAIYLAVRED